MGILARGLIVSSQGSHRIGLSLHFTGESPAGNLIHRPAKAKHRGVRIRGCPIHVAQAFPNLGDHKREIPELPCGLVNNLYTELLLNILSKPGGVLELVIETVDGRPGLLSAAAEFLKCTLECLQIPRIPAELRYGVISLLETFQVISEAADNRDHGFRSHNRSAHLTCGK